MATELRLKTINLNHHTKKNEFKIKNINPKNHYEKVKKLKPYVLSELLHGKAVNFL